VNLKEQAATLNHIHRMYPRLHKQEQRVADAIFDNVTEIVNWSVSQLAKTAGVSDSTVVRTCQRLGYEGYYDLKIALARDLVNPLTAVAGDIEQDETPQGIVDKVFGNNIRTLELTRAQLHPHTLRTVAERVVGADRVEVMAVGTSGPVAVDFCWKLLRAGKKAVAITDPHMQVISASQLGLHDAVIAISHSGSSKDTVESLSIAKSKGCYTVAVTSYPDSPLTKQADVTLLGVSEETRFQTEALSSRIAQLALLDALYVQICLLLGDQAIESLQESVRALSIKKY